MGDTSTMRLAAGCNSPKARGSKEANTILYVCNITLSAIKTVEQEERLNELERELEMLQKLLTLKKTFYSSEIFMT